MSDKGWICLHRKFLDWEWYDDANTMRLFLHCVLRANHKNSTWRGQKILRGQFISSSESLGEDLGLTRNQIRTAINKLKSTGEITSKSTNRYTIITVLNYNSYQDNHQLEPTQTTSRPPADHQQTTTDNNENNNNNENNENKKHRDAQESRPGKTKTSLEIPPWLDIELWHEWLKTRKSRKCPNSARALKTQLNKLQALEEKQPGLANIALEEANGSGWKSIYEPKQAIKKSNDDKELDDWLNGNDSIFNSKTETGNVIEGVFKDA